MWDGDPESLAPGAASPVSCEVRYYDDEDLTDYELEEGGIHPGTWIKQSLSKKWKPAKSGMWIKEAQYFWVARSSGGGITDFTLNILDASFGFPDDYQSKKYKTGTRIEVFVSTSKTAEAIRDESDERMEEETAAYKKTLLGKPPTYRPSSRRGPTL